MAEENEQPSRPDGLDHPGEQDTLVQADRPDMPGHVLELRTAARYLGTSPEALRKRVQRGTVQGYKEGGRWLVVVDKVERDTRTVQDKRPDKGGQTEAALLKDLYERLLAVTEEATRYKALCQVSESSEQHYREQLAALRTERDSLQGEVIKLQQGRLRMVSDLQIERDSLRARVKELEKRRPWWRRLTGRNDEPFFT